MILATSVATVCLVLAFLTSAWANAVSRLTLARARRLQSEHPKRGQILLEIAENPRPYITSTLLILLVARVTFTVVVAGILFRARLAVPEVIAILGISFVLFQIAELAPRSWILERPDQVMLFSAQPVYFLGKLLAPISVFLVKINRIFLLILPGRGLPRGPLTSEEEIKGIIDVAEEEEVIETEEREMLHSVFEFGDTVVREVMCPRPDVVAVEKGATLEDALDLMMGNGFSRAPVIEESIDNVVGIVHIKDLVKKLQNGSRRNRKLGEITREARFVPEFKKVADLLAEMREAKTHMMMVVDEYGGVAGLVTMEDLLEEIVGDIVDEYDREEPNVEQLDEGTLRVDARLGIEELNELLDVALPHTEWDSVGGLVGGTLGRVALEGDVVSVDGIRFEVEKIKGRRIRKVLVSRVLGD